MAGREQQEQASRRLTPREVGELGTEILVHENIHRGHGPRFETPAVWTRQLHGRKGPFLRSIRSVRVIFCGSTAPLSALRWWFGA